MNKSKLKIAFIVQGEGRGHLTQAITAYEMLTNAGHEVKIVLLGKSKNRNVPDYFFNKIKTSVCRFYSPNIKRDKNDKRINLFASLLLNLFLIPKFFFQLRIINNKIKESEADVILNFHETLTGLYFLFFRPKIPIISIAHQYIYKHTDFEFPKISKFSKASLLFINKLSTLGSTKLLALSFSDLKDDLKQKLIVIPPLLRKEIFEIPVNNGDYFVVYILNSGYAREIINWHKKNAAIKLYVFWDKENKRINQNLEFCKLDDNKFLKLLSSSKGLITTAGFESICEAMYLAKPTLMIPVQNHAEQFINSRDAYNSGAGIYDTFFNIDKFIQFSNLYKPNRDFKIWINK
ncbi:MAG: glycosyltransferase family protein, partial [Bacteroidota bacterium]|nr:glycosyltransferase family protein [Bacteroidota bacterium]